MLNQCSDSSVVFWRFVITNQNFVRVYHLWLINMVTPLEQYQLNPAILDRVLSRQVKMTTGKSECRAFCQIYKRMTRKYQSFDHNGFLQGTPLMPKIFAWYCTTTQKQPEDNTRVLFTWRTKSWCMTWIPFILAWIDWFNILQAFLLGQLSVTWMKHKIISIS